MLTMPPEGTDLVLTSNIPHSERDVLVFNGLNIETFKRYEHQAYYNDVVTHQLSE